MDTAGTPLLETERLLLRRLTPADADAIHALDNDPEVMRYLNGGIPTPRDVTEARLNDTLVTPDTTPPWSGFLAVCARDTGAFLGWLSLRPSEANPREAELGYRFLRTAWGHGYATESARALIARAFEANAIDLITATTYEDNEASQRVMHRLGMTLRRRFRPTADALAASETTHRTEAQTEPWPGDDLEFALTREDWQARATD